MARAYIGLGGNIGDTRQILTDAVVCLAQFPSISINARSCFYISAPVEATGEGGRAAARVEGEGRRRRGGVGADRRRHPRLRRADRLPRFLRTGDQEQAQPARIDHQ